MKLQKSTNRSEKIGADRQNKIIPLTRKGKQLTRKGRGKILRFHFLIETDNFRQFQYKKCAADKEKTLSAALLYDVFRKPHRQKVYLKPK